MKTKLLIIIGIIIGIVIVAVSLSYYVIYDSSTTVFVSCDPRYEQIGDKCVLLKPEQYCTGWCDLQELSNMGCNQPALDYIYKHTNLFDEKFDGVYYNNFVGLPDGVTKENFQECVDFILEKRTSVELEESEIDRRRIGWTPAFSYDRVQINGTNASQICSLLKIDCINDPVFDAIYRHDKNYTYFYYELSDMEYLVIIDDGQICYTTDDDFEYTGIFEKCIGIENEN